MDRKGDGRIVGTAGESKAVGLRVPRSFNDTYPGRTKRIETVRALAIRGTLLIGALRAGGVRDRNQYRIVRWVPPEGNGIQTRKCWEK